MKKKKGEYGYRNYRKMIQFLQVLFGTVMILIQLFARNFTDSQSVKNVLTLMAILSVLPTANVASPFIAAVRYKTPEKAFFDRMAAYEGKGTMLYDLIVTTKEQILPFDAVMVHPLGTFAYCPGEKVDVKKAEKTLNQSFKTLKLDPNVKIFKDEKSFLGRLSGLKAALEYEDDGSVDYAVSTLKSMSM